MSTPSEENSGRPEETVTHMLTFGSQYATLAHPIVGIVDPRGWVTITASSHAEVRQIALKHFGTAFSTTYPADRFEKSKHFYPLGELLHIDADTPPLTKEYMAVVIGHATRRWADSFTKKGTDK